jgi:DNA polymerase I
VLVETPPIRRLFVPQDGYILAEFDLKRADPQIVAKESGEESLLQVFRDNIDIYTDMGKWLYKKDKLTALERQRNKNGINACDYNAQASTMATTLGTTKERAAAYIERWRGPTGLYPGIGKWHRRVDEQLRRTRTVYNAYGYRRFYTDRYDENLLQKALAWIASSTVSITIDRGMKHVYGPNIYGDRIADEDRYDPWSERKYIAVPRAQLLLQVHDNIIVQFPQGMEDEIVPLIKERIEVEIPYEKPLVIPATIKVGANPKISLEAARKIAQEYGGRLPLKLSRDFYIDEYSTLRVRKAWGDLQDWEEREAA